MEHAVLVNRLGCVPGLFCSTRIDRVQHLGAEALIKRRQTRLIYCLGRQAEAVVRLASDITRLLNRITQMLIKSVHHAATLTDCDTFD